MPVRKYALTAADKSGLLFEKSLRTALSVRPERRVVMSVFADCSRLRARGLAGIFADVKNAGNVRLPAFTFGGGCVGCSVAALRAGARQRENSFSSMDVVSLSSQDLATMQGLLRGYVQPLARQSTSLDTPRKSLRS